MSTWEERAARAVALTGGASLALSRALAYAPWSDRTPASPVIWGTWDGFLLPAFVAGWASAGLICIIGIACQLFIPRPTRHTWYVAGLSATAAMCAGWSVIWIGGWILHDPVTPWWQTSLMWAGFSAVILGVLGVDKAFHREVR